MTEITILHKLLLSVLSVLVLGTIQISILFTLSDSIYFLRVLYKIYTSYLIQRVYNCVCQVYSFI
jgi:hypothetical protein